MNEAGFIAACVFALALWITVRRMTARIVQIKRQLRALEGEEMRMMDFLHDLGTVIHHDPTLQALSRTIVDGIDKVVTARGGALYFISDDGQSLVPSYVSEHCPPLIGIPMEVQKRAERDPRAIESHIRLSRVPLQEGILGHTLIVGEPLRIVDVKHHESFRDAFVRFQGDVSALIAPLRHGGKDLGVLAVARPHEDGDFIDNDFAVFRSVAEQSAFAIGNARLHREANEKRAMENELRNAREVQRILLPQREPVIEGYRLCGTNVPARIISGDYYDYLDLGEGRHGIVIADVSGKGVPAGLLMAMCRSVLRSVAPAEHSPAKVLGAVNRQLFANIREDMFISLLYMIVEEASGRVVMARAGHDPALWFRRGKGSVESVKSPGLALGIDAGAVFERVTRDHEFQLESGDCLLFYTDGVKEAINNKGEEFGTDRMAEVFRHASPLGAETIVSSMQRELKLYTGESPQMDDITLVAIERR